MSSDEYWMRRALALAEAAAAAGETPIGAILVDSEERVIAEAHNRPIALRDPTAHAEILALREGAKTLDNYRLPVGVTLYVTLEPCAMCAGAISMARVSRLVFAAGDPKGGAVRHGPEFFQQPTCHWRPVWEGGLLADASAEMLRDFFRARRN